MTLYEALNIDLNIPELISVVGAGGKTSTMFRLAKELKAFGEKGACYHNNEYCIFRDITG